VYVREDALVEALDQVIATRVFGPDRHAHLRAGLAALPSRHQQAQTARRDALQAQIDDLVARQDRLITELETTDQADRAFRDRLRRRFDTLETQRADLTAQLHDLEHHVDDEPGGEPALLDALPILEHLNITTAPERIQRRLYDALHLQIHYDRPDQARIRLVLTDDTADALTAAAPGTFVALPTDGAHQNRTPPEARTCAIEPITRATSGALPLGHMPATDDFHGAASAFPCLAGPAGGTQSDISTRSSNALVIDLRAAAGIVAGPASGDLLNIGCVLYRHEAAQVGALPPGRSAGLAEPFGSPRREGDRGAGIIHVLSDHGRNLGWPDTAGTARRSDAHDLAAWLAARRARPATELNSTND
jgi:hypothetical protein